MVFKTFKCIELGFIPDEFEELVRDMAISDESTKGHTYVSYYPGEHSEHPFARWLMKQGAGMNEEILILINW